MRDHLSCFIDGTWQNPDEPNVIDVINPATETPFGRIALGGSSDVDRAVAAARAAFEAWSSTTSDERADLLESIIAAYEQRVDELAATITEEMGAPARLSKAAQATAGLAHLHTTLAAMRDFEFDERRGTTLIRHVPVGVCGLITPWNWSTNQVMCKVAPALAAGCTMVLKPSEFTPFSAIIQAEILEAAGVPAGVFNMVMGDGPTVGAAISSHPGLDMVSFTGSTAAGAAVARAAADTIKRVSQELGGKSPNIVLPDADLAAAVTRGVRSVMTNSGQSCNAPTRMLVPADRHDEACELAANAAARLVVGDPTDGATTTGPVANGRQWQRVQDLIRSGIDEGAALVCGGPGRPDGLDTGWYVRPTVFGGHGDPEQADRVHEAPRPLAHPGDAFVGGGRRDEHHRLDTGAVGGGGPRVDLLEGEVGEDRAGHPAAVERVGEPLPCGRPRWRRSSPRAARRHRSSGARRGSTPGWRRPAGRAPTPPG